MITSLKKVNKKHSLYYKAITFTQDHKPLSQRNGVYSKINTDGQNDKENLNQELLSLIDEVILKKK